MSVRLNFRQERFALELYAGKTPYEAMERAGYKPHPENARRLAQHPNVRRRISEMFAQERGYVEIEAMQCRRERRLIAFADIANYYEPSIDANGQPTGRVRVKNFTDLPRELTAAIASIRPTKLGWEIKLHDKDASLRAIEDRVDPSPDKSGGGVAVLVNQTVNNEVTGTTGARDRIAERIEKLAGRTVGDPSSG